MKIIVKVKTNAKREKIQKIETVIFKIWVNVLPERGKANKRIIELLSEYFKVPKSKINIVCGEKLKNKIIEIKT